MGLLPSSLSFFFLFFYKKTRWSSRPPPVDPGWGIWGVCCEAGAKGAGPLNPIDGVAGGLPWRGGGEGTPRLFPSGTICAGGTCWVFKDLVG